MKFDNKIQVKIFVLARCDLIQNTLNLYYVSEIQYRYGIKIEYILNTLSGILSGII